MLSALSNMLKKTVQGVDSVKQETAGKDVSLVLRAWDQQGSWHDSLECYLTECVAQNNTDVPRAAQQNSSQVDGE